jgi:hypothetical protein
MGITLVRPHLLGLTEHSDFDQTCGELARCNTYKGWKKSMKHFIGKGYTIAKENAGGMESLFCAQDRVGHALVWLKKLYAMRKDNLPDYLLLEDDDTYFDLASFEDYVMRKELDPSKTEMHGACLFRQSGYIKWSFPYGGFGMGFTRASIERLLCPIHCKNTTSENEFIQGPRMMPKSDEEPNRRTSRVSGRNEYRRRVFHVNSALRMFCIHSDWLTGYIANFYGLSERDADTEDEEDREMRMYGMAVWPEQCGNRTMICVDRSDVCHRQGPHALQHFAMISYSSTQPRACCHWIPSYLANETEILPWGHMLHKKTMRQATGAIPSNVLVQNGHQSHHGNRSSAWADFTRRYAGNTS